MTHGHWAPRCVMERTDFSRLSRVELLVVAVMAHCFLEGGIRKWIFPSAGTLILLGRDVIILGIILLLVQSNGTLNRSFVFYVVVVTVVVGIQTVLVGNRLFFALTGWRAYVLLPLMIAIVAQRSTQFALVQRLVQTVMVLSSLQLPFILAQLASPKTAFINKILAADGSDNIGLAGEIVRPTGTFTSSAGLGAALLLALSLSIADVLAGGALSGTPIARWCSIFVGLGIVFSGSRQAIMMSILVIAGMGLCALSSKSASDNKFWIWVFSSGVAVWLALHLNEEYVGALSARIESATSSESPILRVLGDLTGWISALPRSTLLGEGVGSAGNVAVASGNAERAAWIESDLSRSVIELGWPLGLLIVLCRLLAAAVIVSKTYTARRSHPYLLVVALPISWMLATGAILGQGTVMTICGLGVGILFRTMSQGGRN